MTKSLARYPRGFGGGDMAREKKQDRPGRPRGKKSDPNFIHVGGYIRRDTYRAMKHLLIDRDLEISELLQQLIDEWIYDNYLPPRK